MPLDHYVTLGRSGLRVSPFCLGAMTFGGEWGMGGDADQSIQVLDRFMELGGNFVDTANIYSRGHSEVIIGDHIGHDPAKRQRMVIATKFSGNLLDRDPNGGGANRKSIIAACEQSLRRLRTDYIDLYWMHWNDPYTPVEETIHALDDLTRQGKIRYAGFSDTPAWRVTQAQMTARMAHLAPLIALQIEYSLMQRTVEGDLTPMAIEMGLGVTPWGPMAAGVLSGKYSRENRTAVSAGRASAVGRNLTDKGFAVLEVLSDVAEEAGTTSGRAALAWVAGRPGVTSPIIGARTVAQLDDNIPALDVKLTPEQIARLDEVSKPVLPFPHDFLPRSLAATYPGMTVNGDAYPGSPMAGSQGKVW